MNQLAELSEVVMRAMSGEEISNETVDDCSARVTRAFLAQWFDGQTELAKEMDTLLERLKNSSDPRVKDLGMMERQMLKQGIKFIQRMKESRNEDPEEIAQAAASAILDSAPES